MHTKFADRTLKVLVLESNDARRMQISQSLKSSLIKDVTVARSVQDGFSLLQSESEAPDWIITGIMADEPVNAFHLLTLSIRNKKYRQTCISFLFKEGESEYLNNAFEMGLFSAHRADLTGQELASELKTLFNIGSVYNWRTSLVSAFYLRGHLIERGQTSELVELEKTLLSLYPDEPQLLLTYAKALHHAGKTGPAIMALNRAKTQNPDLSKEVSQLLEEFSVSGNGAGTKGQPSESVADRLGLDVCVIIDGDDAVRMQLKEALVELGVSFIKTFSDGNEAWQWLKDNDEPNLIIQEWRIPKLSGNILVQRLRNANYVKVPIVVYSSLVKGKDRILLQEMGVTDIMEKPLPRQQLRATLTAILEQHATPDTKALTVRIRLLLGGKRFAEANAIRDELFNNEDLDEGTRKAIEAEFAYHEGRLRQAKDLALDAMHTSGESLPLLNLIARILNKVKEYDLALKFMNRAQSLSPQNIARLCTLAEIQCEVGNMEAATAAISSAKQIDEESEMVLATESKIALSTGDTDRAKELLEQTEAMTSVVAFLNNRAASLARQNKFEEATELYQNALKSLPKKDQATRSIISYNLGLGYARTGNLEQAIAYLEKASDSNEDSAIRLKASSLLKRANEAIHDGSSLVLRTATPIELTSSAMNDFDSMDVAAIPVALDIKRGDLCLHLVYQPKEGLLPSVAKLIANTPSFSERKTLEWGAKKKKKAPAEES